MHKMVQKIDEVQIDFQQCELIKCTSADPTDQAGDSYKLDSYKKNDVKIDGGAIEN